METIDAKKVWWSGVAYLPGKHLIYAANRGTGVGPSNVVVFDAQTRQIVTRIPVEINPYATVLSKDGRRLFVSNWASESVSVIDTGTNKVIRTLHVGMNPNDMKLSADGRLFVACSNDNTIHVIDTNTLEVIERLSTTLTPFAPEGSTPDAIEIDNKRKLLYVANADNNSIAVIRIAVRGHSAMIGFIPTGWYPSALALAENNNTLFIGNGKGEEGHPDLKGVGSPLASKWYGDETVKTLQKSSIEVLPVTNLRQNLPKWTHEVIENTPYNDSLLSEARPPKEPTILPREVGVETPIKHVIYIIKENRTYDQEFGRSQGRQRRFPVNDLWRKSDAQPARARQAVRGSRQPLLRRRGQRRRPFVVGLRLRNRLQRAVLAVDVCGSQQCGPTRAYVPSAGICGIWRHAKDSPIAPMANLPRAPARHDDGCRSGTEGLIGHVAPIISDRDSAIQQKSRSF